MQRKELVRVICAVSVMLVAACGGPAANPAPTSAPAASGARVNVAKSSLGQILVDDKGMTLYMFANDTNGQSSCYDACAQSWPALSTPDKP
jgi:predicted lipoprotein with Yx(FWY)xxD motif